LSSSKHEVNITGRTITNLGVIDDVKEIKTDCRRLVIVEKESAMYQMHQEITKIIEKGNNNINKISQ